MAEAVLQFNAASILEDVLHKHGKRLSDIDLASRRAEEASLRRYEAAAWLRKMAGFVGAKNLPANPSEEEFRLGLRSGIMLCNVLNKVQFGVISKVVEAPPDTVILPDGAALSAYQYFENIRNFLDVIQEWGIPAFEASDLEQGGKSSRVVNSLLALKSYDDWKRGGGNGIWKFSGHTTKPSSVCKQFFMKNSDLFMKSVLDQKSTDTSSGGGDHVQELDEAGSTSNPLHVLIREILSDKPREDIPLVVENMLSKVMEEFEQRLAVQSQQAKIGTSSKENGFPGSVKPPSVELKTSRVRKDAENGAAKHQEKRIDNVVAKHREEPIDNGTEKQQEDPIDIDNGAEKHQEIPIDNDAEKHQENHIDNGAENQQEIRIDNGAAKQEEYDSGNGAENHQELIENQQELLEQLEQLENQRKELELTASQRKELELAERQRRQQELAHLERKQYELVEHQQKNIHELKNTLHSTRQDMSKLQTKHQEEVQNLGIHLRTMAHAASNYQKVLEENRKLYNQVQDLKGNIRVYCRVRPFMPGKPTGVSSVGDIDERAITILTPAKTSKDAKKSFSFNKAFGPLATQEEVFADTQPLIRSVLDGYNVCIFAYGQTGSGKTYTMTGPDTITKESLGVNFRALSDLFLISEQRQDTIAYTISVQMIEIYNELVRDLLSTDGVTKKSLEIRNNTHNGVNVPSANLVPVTTPSDVINLMNLGHKNRAVGSTAMNNRSSRSHSCLTVHVQGKDLTSGAVIRGCMHLVDLAGSERADKTEATGDRLKEAQYINRSLSALGDVISSLAQKNAHVPYRNSKLTQLLQDALGGQAKTLMFVHISPEPDALSETISTLKFAERVSTVELGAAKTNKDNSQVKELKEQIASLKAALAQKEAGELSSLLSYGSSPSLSSCISVGDIASLASRRHSLDGQDSSMNSPPWPVVSNPGLVEDDKSVSDDWVDKVMVNKQDALCDEDSKQLPEMFYQQKVYPEQQAVKNNRRNSLDNGSTITDDSDELEATNSELSELDYQLQVNVSKSKATPNLLGSKLKKASPKAQRSTPDKTKSLIPQPTKKSTNGSQSPLHRNVRQQGPVDGRRKQAASVK